MREILQEIQKNRQRLPYTEESRRMEILRSLSQMSVMGAVVGFFELRSMAKHTGRWSITHTGRSRTVSRLGPIGGSTGGANGRRPPDSVRGVSSEDAGHWSALKVSTLFRPVSAGIFVANGENERWNVSCCCASIARAALWESPVRILNPWQRGWDGGHEP